tara:strand:- start:22 stop:510 length:489 start_codon:yes stop_codon:yes gene_type:complete
LKRLTDEQRSNRYEKFVAAYNTNGGNAKGAAISAGITPGSASKIGVELRRKLIDKEPSPGSNGHGFFYIIDLIPDAHELNRLKFGFTKNVDHRLEEHRTAAPTAQVLKSWPCKRVWEQAAIDALGRHENQIRTEVFDVRDVDAVIHKGEQFFLMMPEVPNDS